MTNNPPPSLPTLPALIPPIIPSSLPSHILRCQCVRMHQGSTIASSIPASIAAFISLLHRSPLRHLVPATVPPMTRRCSSIASPTHPARSSLATCSHRSPRVHRDFEGSEQHEDAAQHRQERRGPAASARACAESAQTPHL